MCYPETTDDSTVQDLRSVQQAIEGAKGYVQAVVSDIDNPNAFARREQEILDRITYLNRSLSMMRDHRDRGPEILVGLRARLKKLRKSEAMLVNKVRIAKLLKLAKQVNEFGAEDVAEDDAPKDDEWAFGEALEDEQVLDDAD